MKGALRAATGGRADLVLLKGLPTGTLENPQASMLQARSAVAGRLCHSGFTQRWLAARCRVHPAWL